MHVLQLTAPVAGRGEVPNGVILYIRDHPFHPYVVHNYAERPDSSGAVELSLFEGDYCETLEDAAERFRSRTAEKQRTNLQGSAFLKAVERILTFKVA